MIMINFEKGVKCMNRKAFGLFAFMFCSLLVIGCTNTSLHGKWILVDDVGITHEFEFKSDNTFTYDVFSSDGTLDNKVGTYKEQCDKLILSITNEPDTIFIYAINCNTLILIPFECADCPNNNPGFYIRK